MTQISFMIETGSEAMKIENAFVGGREVPPHHLENVNSFQLPRVAFEFYGEFSSLLR
jgi:hypothetical protein